MYKIIGADQKEYGPITADQLRQWIAEGRINGNTKVQMEGVEGWKTVSELPEFATALPVSAPPSPRAPAPVAMAPAAAKANQLAVWSMITGILTLLCCCGVLGPVPIVLGSIALSQIKKNPQQTGSGFAITGIILGILSLIIVAVQIIMFIANPDFITTIQNSFPH